MRSFISVAALALLPLTVTSTSDAAPAYAGADIRSSNVVLFDSCTDYPFSYNLAVPTNADDWSAEVEVIARDGNVATTAFLYGSSAYDDTGREEMFLCGDDPGRYRFRADVSWYDRDYNESGYSVSGSTFTVRHPRSKTGIKARRGSRLTFNVTVKDERPRGFFPSDEYTTVLLQQKRGGRWVRVSSGYLNSKGKVRFSRPNGNGREVFRAKAAFASYEDIADSYSRPVALR